MKITKKGCLSFGLTLVMAGFLLAPLAQAQESQWINVVGNDLNVIGNTAFQTDQPKDLRLIVSDVIKVILGILGTIFVVLAISAGIRWMTSNGNTTSIGKAKQTLYAAVIGLLIVLASFAITIFITRASSSVTQEDNYVEGPINE